MKVNFMVIGAQKCATTTLFQILTRHPRIAGCRLKEPHFFSTSPDWRAGLDEYHALYDDRPDILHFEASTSYTFYPHRRLEIWNDIHAYNPQMKFIYLVRRPIARVVSSYMHNVTRGYTTESLERLVLSHPLLLNVTRYHTQILPYIRRFGRERVLLIDFDDFINQRRPTMATVTRFLGVDLEGLGDFESVHANKSIGSRKRHYRFDNPSPWLRVMRKLTPGLYQRIVERFSPDLHQRPEPSDACRRMIVNMLTLEVQALEELMEKDLSHWLDCPAEDDDAADASHDAAAGESETGPAEPADASPAARRDRQEL